MAILLPFELALLFVAGNDTPALVFYTLLGVLLTPPFMAGFVAATVSKSNPHARDSYGVTPFIATRPLTSAALIAAKLKVTIWSTLAAWLLVLVAIPLALTLSGTSPVVIERARQVIDAVGTPRAIVVVLLVFSGLMASTWKQLVQSLYIGLTGREWLIKASVFLALSFLVVIGPIVEWIRDDGDVQAALWDALPWILAVLVCVKMSAAAWIATRLYRQPAAQRPHARDRRGLLAVSPCSRSTVCSCGSVDTPLIPRYFLVLVAILAIPLARLSAAPLALAWNRHR